MKKVKLSVIHAKYLSFTPDADPKSKSFSKEAALKHVRANIAGTLERMEEAGRNKVDMVCTIEDFTAAGSYKRAIDHPDLFRSLAARVAPEVDEQAGGIAKKYSIHIAANYYQFEGETMYNTTTLFGRDGGIIGKYRKVHPAEGELPFVKPGDSYPVFETDFGNVGIAICYDMIFPEPFRCLTLNGADIIVLQTMGWGTMGNSKDIPVSGEALMRVRAMENGVYFVVAKNIQGEGGKSLILDNSGNIIAEAPGVEERLLIGEFEPDYEMYDPFNYDNYYGDVHGTKARQLLARMPHTYKVITDEVPPVIAARYLGIKLNADPGRMSVLVRRIQEMDEQTRAKYHS